MGQKTEGRSPILDMWLEWKGLGKRVPENLRKEEEENFKKEVTDYPMLKRG